MIVTDAVGEYFERTQEYFSLKLQIPRYRRHFKNKQTFFDRLLREFALATKVHVPDGSANRVHLHAILSLPPHDFNQAIGDYLSRTKNLELFPESKDDLFADRNSTYVISFMSYIHSLQRKRLLERLFMGVAKDTDKAQKKEFDRKREQDSINTLIESNQKSGWDWLEKSEAKEEKLRQGGRGAIWKS